MAKDKDKPKEATKEEDETEPKPGEKPAEGEEGAASEAGEGEAGAEGDPSAKPKFKFTKKMLIIVAVAGVVVIGAGTAAALYFTGAFNKKADAEHAEGDAAHGEEAEAEEKGEDGEKKAVFYQLGDVMVNLSGEGKRPNFLKIKVALELASEKDLPKMETIKPRIIDNFQVYLRELRIDDLRGSAGLYRLREELLLRVTEAAQPVRIRDVLFQEMLVQ